MTTKVAILDEQSMDSYIQVDNRNKAVSYVHDPELSDETNNEEYRKFLNKTSYAKRQLHIHPNFNHNLMQIYGNTFTSIFKNVVYFEKHRKNKTLFNVCQFKGSTLEHTRYGTMDTNYLGSTGNYTNPKNEKYRFKVKWSKQKEYVNSVELLKYIEENNLTYSVFKDDLVNLHLEEEQEYLFDMLQGNTSEAKNRHLIANSSDDELSEVKTEKSVNFSVT